jgi:hypothetical protein
MQLLAVREATLENVIEIVPEGSSSGMASGDADKFKGAAENQLVSRARRLC